MKKAKLRNDKTANVVLSKNGQSKPSFASIEDTLILNVKKDTNLQNLADELNKLAKVYNNKIKYTKSTVKAHIRYRIVTQRKKDYLSSHNLRLDEKNFMLKVIKSKTEKIDNVVTETVNN